MFNFSGKKSAADLRRMLDEMEERRNLARAALAEKREGLREAAVSGKFSAMKADVRTVEDDIEELTFQIEAVRERWQDQTKAEIRDSAAALVARADKIAAKAADEIRKKYIPAAEALVHLALLCGQADNAIAEASNAAAAADIPCDVASAEERVSTVGRHTKIASSLVLHNPMTDRIILGPGGYFDREFTAPLSAAVASEVSKI